MTVDQNISTRINLMRIFLISGIVFVHVPFDVTTTPYAGHVPAFDWLRVFLGDSFFRIGVPCLSAISGYLLFRRGMEAFDYAKVVRSKVVTLLVPFLFWNLSVVLVVGVAQSQGIGVGYFPDVWGADFRTILSHMFSLEDFPIDLPLYFLRDLFVCILVSPVLALAVRRAPWITCVVLFGLAILPSVTVGLVLKKSILFSFTFGIAIALNKVDVKQLDRYALPGTLLTLLAAGLLSIPLYLTGPDYPYLIDLARNALSIVGALGFWLMSALMIRTALGTRLSQTGSLSFWIFCAHYPLLVFLWMIWNRFFGDVAYAGFYVGALATTFFILVVTNAAFMRFLPEVYQLLTGSRGRNAQKPRDFPKGQKPFSSQARWHEGQTLAKVKR